ncbi:MAG: D-aminoacyl-tRNA deacylase, partial [Thermoplasmata archaeon]
MDLILFSTDDKASMNIFENIVSIVDLKELGKFRNIPYYRFKDFYLVTIENEKVRAENIDSEIKNSLGIEFENIIVASKH